VRKARDIESTTKLNALNGPEWQENYKNDCRHDEDRERNAETGVAKEHFKYQSVEMDALSTADGSAGYIAGEGAQSGVPVQDHLNEAPPTQPPNFLKHRLYLAILSVPR
jgi:hypothetical protein